MNRMQIYTLILLICISPLFSIYLASLVGYREPIDIVAEELKLSEAEFSWTPLKDYTIPGLPDWLGQILTGAIGVAIIFALGFAVKLLMGSR